MRARLLVSVLVAGGALGAVVPAGASAALVVQQSIAGVKLDMTRAQVEAKLGEPDGVKRPSSEIFGVYTELRYGLTRVSLFDGDDGKVFAVTTTSKKQRTSKDVGVGSSEKVLKQRVKGVKCTTYVPRFRICTVGRAEPGRRITDFRMSPKTGRVNRITLGYVID